MKKKFAVVKAFGHFGTHVITMNKEDFETCNFKCEILFESDNSSEVANKYKEIISSFNDIIHV